MSALSRRALLRGGCAGLGGLVWGCGRGEETPTPSPQVRVCGVEPGPGWVELPLAEHPALVEVGGWEALSAPELLLDVNVAHVEAGCYVAAWRICPHGACYLSYEAPSRQFVCPCHGSRFGEDGSLLAGPATRGLATFPAGLADGSVWVAGPTAAREAP